MDTLKFKTNINCSGCLMKVSPFLNKAEGVESWNVDLESDDRILTVTCDAPLSEEIPEIVRRAGFQAETVV